MSPFPGKTAFSEFQAKDGLEILMFAGQDHRIIQVARDFRTCLDEPPSQGGSALRPA